MIPFAINRVMAAIVFVIGRWAARLASRIIARLLRRAHTDESLVKFIADVAYALLLAVVVIAALERLGLKTTAAVAISARPASPSAWPSRAHWATLPPACSS